MTVSICTGLASCAFLMRVLKESAGEKQEGGGYGGWARQHWETQKLLTPRSSSTIFLRKVSFDDPDGESHSKGASTIAVICPTGAHLPILSAKVFVSVDALTPRPGLDNSSNLSFPQLRSRTPRFDKQTMRIAGLCRLDVELEAWEFQHRQSSNPDDRYTLAGMPVHEYKVTEFASFSEYWYWNTLDIGSRLSPPNWIPTATKPPGGLSRPFRYTPTPNPPGIPTVRFWISRP